MSNRGISAVRSRACSRSPTVGVAAFDDHVGQAEAGEDLEGAGLDGQGSGLVGLVGLSIDDPDTGAERVQLGGQGQAGRSCADHQHVCGQRAPLGRRSRSPPVRASSVCHGAAHAAGEGS